MIRKPFWLLTGAILLAAILMSGCAPSTRNIKTREFPKYISSGLQETSFKTLSAPAANACQVTTVALLSSWVNAGASETGTFDFTGFDGKACQGSFAADVLPLFTTANLWYAGALSCRTCHGPDVTVSYGGLDLGSYSGIKAGAGGQDILGGGSWQNARLNEVLSSGMMPPAKPAGYDINGPIVYAGTLK